MLDNMDKLLFKLKNLVIKYRVLVTLIVIVFTIISATIYLKQEKDIKIIEEYYIEKGTNTEKDNTDVTIVIYITGAVINPGVYILQSGSRISDAISIAGGLQDNANIKNINLAKKLNDGEKIYIYTYDEDIVEEVVNNSENGKVNINTKSIDELITLPGIGNATAKKIIEYTNKNGDFNKIEDIKNVSGIGESKYNKIKDMITVY